MYFESVSPTGREAEKPHAGCTRRGINEHYLSLPSEPELMDRSRVASDAFVEKKIRPDWRALNKSARVRACVNGRVNQNVGANALTTRNEFA